MDHNRTAMLDTGRVWPDCVTDASISTFTIAITNVAPVAFNQGTAASPAYTVFDGVANTVGTASGLTANATDVDNTPAQFVVLDAHERLGQREAI